MEDRAIRDIIIGLLVTIVGGVIVAWIVQEGARFQPTPTPTIENDQQVIPTPDYPHVLVENHLVLPVKVYINDDYKNTVGPAMTTVFVVDSFPAKVDFETMNLTQDADSMSGSWSNVSNGCHLTTSNVIGDQFFFFVVINNNTSVECDVYIDKGYITEKHPGTLPANGQNIGMGYYRLSYNSNVSLQCANGSGYWWGIQPGQQQPEASIIEIVQPTSGLLEVGIGP